MRQPTATEQRPGRWSRADLTYCTNVHPGESAEQVRAVIAGPLAAVRQRRRLERMGSGLWLSAAAAAQLHRSESDLQAFTESLQSNAIELFTLNGFPYGNFHAGRVKQAVYQPDWSQQRRLAYSLDLARVLSRVVPAGMAEGSISSVPLGFAPGWDENREQAALEQLCRCVASLDSLQQETGRSLRLCLEMEPGCALERTEQLIPWFSERLPEALAHHNMDPDLARRHLGICFDVCHQAVMFEDCHASLQQIHRAGIPIGKIQISSALELADPADPEGRRELARFAEARYLHQSCCRQGDELRRVMDLDQALESLPRDTPWRCHFHVPIQSRELFSQRLGTTQAQILRTLDFLTEHPEVHPHLEVETYTWQVLPEALRPADDAALINGLNAELEWLERAMSNRGLLAESTV